MVGDRADEGVAREQRAGVQEGDHGVGAQDDLRRKFSGNDLIEDIHASKCRANRRRWANPSTTLASGRCSGRRLRAAGNFGGRCEMWSGAGENFRKLSVAWCTLVTQSNNCSMK